MVCPNVLKRRMISNIIEAMAENEKIPPKSANKYIRLGTLGTFITKNIRSEAKYTIDDRIVFARIIVLFLKGRLPM